MSRITAGAVNALRLGATACATMPLVLVIVCYYFRRTRKSNTKDLSVASWVPFNCNRRPGSQVVRPRPDSVKLPIVFPSPPNNILLLTLSCPLYPSSPATLTPINNGKWMLEGVPARFQADKKGVLQQKCHTRERLQSRLQWKQRERERAIDSALSPGCNINSHHLHHFSQRCEYPALTLTRSPPPT